MTTGTTASRRGKVRAARLNGVDTVEADDGGLLLTVTFLATGARRDDVFEGRAAA
ncbi:hypothetical protein [Streptomyces tuirus]